MNIIAAIITIKPEVKIEDIADIINHEREVLKEWTSLGYIHDLYLRQTRNGAVIMFKDMDEQKVREMVATLPLFPYLLSVEYLPLLKQSGAHS
jgi:muconolactone D-isomerase